MREALVTGYFADSKDAEAAVLNLSGANFDTNGVEVLTGERAVEAVKRRRSVLRWHSAAIGAAFGLVVSLIVMLLYAVGASALKGLPWYALIPVTLMAIVLCSGFGAYYGMFSQQVNEEAVLVGLKVPKERLPQAKTILLDAGGTVVGQN